MNILLIVIWIDNERQEAEEEEDEELLWTYRFGMWFNFDIIHFDFLVQWNLKLTPFLCGSSGWMDGAAAPLFCLR